MSGEDPAQQHVVHLSVGIGTAVADDHQAIVQIAGVAISSMRYRPGNASTAPWSCRTFASPALTIVCEPCDRRGRYNVERLMAKHGDAKILYLLAELTSCPKTQSANIYDRWKARYEGLSIR